MRKLLAALAFAFAATAHADPLSEGRRLMGEGRLGEAIEVLGRVTLAEPDNAAAWNALGSALNQTERYDEALVAAEKAVTLDPSFAHRFNRGLVNWEHGRFAEALRDHDAALAARPGFAPALTERGAALAALGRIEEAKASWSEALAADPAYIWSRYYRGVAAVVAGDFAAAAADLDAVAAKESLASVRLWQWVAHRRAGRAAPELDLAAEWPGPVGQFLQGRLSAGELLAEARRERPAGDDRRVASALYFIGQKHLADGRTGEARAAFREALAIDAPRHSERAGAEAELQRLGAARQ